MLVNICSALLFVFILYRERSPKLDEIEKKFPLLFQIDAILNFNSLQASVLRGMNLFLTILNGRSGLSLIQTPTGPSSSAQTYAMTVPGALALSMPTAPRGMVHVAPTQVGTATLGGTKTATRRARTGSAASKLCEGDTRT